MSSSQIYYVTTLLVYAGVDIMACLALNLQFGVSGLVNFGLIVFQAAGAYAAAVLSMPPDTANGGFQQYVLGLQLPFPLPWLGVRWPAACWPSRSACSCFDACAVYTRGSL